MGHLWPSHTCVICGVKARSLAPGLQRPPDGLAWPVPRISTDDDSEGSIGATDHGAPIGRGHSNEGKAHSSSGRSRSRSQEPIWIESSESPSASPERCSPPPGLSDRELIERACKPCFETDDGEAQPSIGSTDQGVPISHRRKDKSIGSTDHGDPSIGSTSHHHSDKISGSANDRDPMFGLLRWGPYQGERIHDPHRFIERDSDLECLFLELLTVYPGAQREDYFIESFGRAWRKKAIELDIAICTDYRQRCAKKIAAASPRPLTATAHGASSSDRSVASPAPFEAALQLPPPADTHGAISRGAAEQASGSAGGGLTWV